jgi:trehalose 6-phosphate synthase/phosphatase
MFRSLRSASLDVDNVFACTIGPSSKQTLARWHLPQPENVISAIAMLNNADEIPDDLPTNDDEHNGI